jgi:hypothetical protein
MWRPSDAVDPVSVALARYWWIQWCRALVAAMRMREQLRGLRKSLDD